VPAYHIFDAEGLVPYLLYRNGRVVDGLRFDEAEGATPAEAVLAWAKSRVWVLDPDRRCTVWAVDTATGEHTRVRLTATWEVSYEAAALPAPAPEPEPAP
jgi:hypothetical protein